MGRLGAWLARFHPKRGPTLSPRARWGMRAIAFALGALGPAAFIQSRAITILLVIAAAGSALQPGAIDRARDALRWPTAVFLAAGLAWLLISLAWSPLPDARWAVDVLGPIMLGFFLLGAAPALDAYYWRLLLLILGTSIAVLIAAVAVEAVLDGAISALLRGRAEVAGNIYSKGGVFATIFLVPLLYLLRRYGAPVWVGAAFAVVAGAAVFDLSIRAAQLAIAVSLPAALFAWWRPRIAVSLLGVMVAVYCVISPWLAADWLNSSVLQAAGVELPRSGWHRIEIWEFAGERIRETPFFGRGFNAARWFGTQGLTVTLPGDQSVTANQVPIHTHNGFLMIWFDFGLIGVLLLLAAWASLIRALYRRLEDPLWAAAAVGSMVAVLVFFTVSFSPWRAWFLATFFVLALVLREMRGVNADPPRPD